MGGRWPYSCCLVGCYFQDLFTIAPSMLVQFPSSFFSIYFISVNVVHPYSSIDTTAAWKKFRFNLSDRSDFHMVDSLLISVHAFTRCILRSLSVDKMLLPRYVNESSNFREQPFRVEMSLSWLKHIYSILPAFTWRPMPPVVCSRLCGRDSAHTGVFARSAMSSALSASVNSFCKILSAPYLFLV